MAFCDCRGEYFFGHGSRTLFPANSVNAIQGNNLGLLSWLAEFLSYNWHVKALQN